MVYYLYSVQIAISPYCRILSSISDIKANSKARLQKYSPVCTEWKPLTES